MRYESKVCKRKKDFFLYLDNESRCHFLLDKKITEQLNKEDLKVEKWYNCNIKENLKGEIIWLCLK